MKTTKLKDDLLYYDIEKRIDSIKGKKNINIFLFRLTKIIVFIAGATVTVITGWRITNSDLINFNPDNYVLIISAAITVLAAIEGLFNFKDKGKSNNLLLFELRRLRDRICFDFDKNPDIYEKNKEAHFLNFQEILESQKVIIENSDNDEE
ncbi:SLATT domain-containing protein [Flavobacterium sp. MMLR14_040]|uniref:SLATT domain-containing protein n=1 Tax=Flavobacterium sp. MMLR14_040 TaxID=3093843 RepID=UPI00298FE4BB|nr:SLATT domain-containing protein [Flavobacterium sp. MMLR14_040]MDW8851661.1 SLATT domain-containing protein [Flavobacterium sp. MMLR14_040]